MRQALERDLAKGGAVPDLDGNIVDTGQCREKITSRKGKAIDLWYAGNTRLRREIQDLFYPSAIPLLISGVLPGIIHD